MSALDELKPNRKRLVFDLAEEAGIDITDWIGSSRSENRYKANPKYCYNWSLLTPGLVLVLNLWFESLAEESDGTVTCSENYRADASELSRHNGKAKWIERGTAFDKHLQEAGQQALPLRVIVNHGVRRERGDADAAPSKVQFRDLDPVPWHIRSYDRATGDFVLARGRTNELLVDQFDELVYATSREVSTRVFYDRDAAVRRAVLARSGGRCELCGAEGFVVPDGARYLETHHIIPLCEGGPDIVANVIALCANDHRRAHYSVERDEIRSLLVRLIVH